MHVIPDILPNLQPTVDLRVVFSEAPPKNIVLRARAKRKTVPIEAGVFLVNEQVNADAEAIEEVDLTTSYLDAPLAKTLRNSFPSGAKILYFAYGRPR